MTKTMPFTPLLRFQHRVRGWGGRTVKTTEDLIRPHRRVSESLISRYFFVAVGSAAILTRCIWTFGWFVPSPRAGVSAYSSSVSSTAACNSRLAVGLSQGRSLYLELPFGSAPRLWGAAVIEIGGNSELGRHKMIQKTTPNFTCGQLVSPTLPEDEGVSGWLSPPHRIFRDQVRSTCSRAR